METVFLPYVYYEPYYFNERTIFFSHNKSVNGIFSYDFFSEAAKILCSTFVIRVCSAYDTSTPNASDGRGPGSRRPDRAKTEMVTQRTARARCTVVRVLGGAPGLI